MHYAINDESHDVTNRTADDSGEYEVTGKRAVGIERDDEAAEPHDRPAGDSKDDDGQAIDDYFTPNPNGPNVREVLQRMPGFSVDDTAPKVSRVLTMSYSLLAASDPIQLLPADANRKSLVIIAQSTTAADQVKIAGQKSDVYGAGNWPMNLLYRSPGWTGAIWVYAPAAVGTVTVSFWSVTS